ncbi:hypothetical protein FOZ62_003648 [Perkinsus olseni]|uniref:C3H1-type domain-containing protein n=1 Tax=Perkinsus olseni TaxID=32597 RepID=A0A7J6TAP1_PEROL|nr:hypothetical protein FOZ62_003648 [Perkinsus olseni]
MSQTTGMAAGPGLKGDSTPTAVAAAAGKTTENSYRRNRVWRGNGPSTGTLRWVVKPYYSRSKGGGKGGAHSRFRGGPKHRDGRKGSGRVELDKTSTIAESVEAYEDEEEPRKGSSAQSTASGGSSPVSEALASSPAEEHTGPCSTTSSATSSSQSSKTRPGPSPDAVGQEPFPQDMAVSTSLRIAWGAMTCTCPECTQRVADSVLKCFTERKTWTPGEAVDVGNEISSMVVGRRPILGAVAADNTLSLLSFASTRLSSPSSSSYENAAYTKHPCRLRLVGDMSRACREELLYGRCKRGTACQFSHDRSHAEALRKMHKSQMCRWGRDCYFGSNCLYSHSQAEIADAQAWLIGGPLDKYSRERYLVHQSQMTTDLFTELQRKHQYRYEDPFYPTAAMVAPGGGGLAPMLLQPGGPPPAEYGGNRGMGRHH